jgi:hypothetical protein
MGVISNSLSLRDLVDLESNCTEKDYFYCEEMTENNDEKMEEEEEEEEDEEHTYTLY